MEKHMKRFCAEFIQSGTNERLSVNADTLEELDTLLYGRPYPAKRSSVKIYERSAVARRVVPPPWTAAAPAVPARPFYG